MASDKPDDSVRLYSILNRPEGEIAKMGEISVSKKLKGGYTGSYNFWAYINGDVQGKAT